MHYICGWFSEIDIKSNFDYATLRHIKSIFINFVTLSNRVNLSFLHGRYRLFMLIDTFSLKYTEPEILFWNSMVTMTTISIYRAQW